VLAGCAGEVPDFVSLNVSKIIAAVALNGCALERALAAAPTLPLVSFSAPDEEAVNTDICDGERSAFVAEVLSEAGTIELVNSMEDNPVDESVLKAA